MRQADLRAILHRRLPHESGSTAAARSPTSVGAEQRFGGVDSIGDLRPKSIGVGAWLAIEMSLKQCDRSSTVGVLGTSNESCRSGVHTRFAGGSKYSGDGPRGLVTASSNSELRVRDSAPRVCGQLSALRGGETMIGIR